MIKFRKSYNVKIIFLIVSITSLFASILYAYSGSKDSLRLPIGQEDTYQRFRTAALFEKFIKTYEGTVLSNLGEVRDYWRDVRADDRVLVWRGELLDEQRTEFMPKASIQQQEIYKVGRLPIRPRYSVYRLNKPCRGSKYLLVDTERTAVADIHTKGCVAFDFNGTIYDSEKKRLGEGIAQVFIDLLNKGFKVIIITNNKIEDLIGEEGKLITDEGRFILDLVEKGSLRDFVIYADNRTKKYRYDHSSGQIVEEIGYRMGFESEEAKERIWKEVEETMTTLSKDEGISLPQYQVRDKDTQVRIDVELDKATREVVEEALEKALEGEGVDVHPGRTGIYILRSGLDKSLCMEDAIETIRLEREHVVYIGDRFIKGAKEDNVVVEKNGVLGINVGEVDGYELIEGVIDYGKGIEGTGEVMEIILRSLSKELARLKAFVEDESRVYAGGRTARAMETLKDIGAFEILAAIVKDESVSISYRTEALEALIESESLDLLIELRSVLESIAVMSTPIPTTRGPRTVKDAIEDDMYLNARETAIEALRLVSPRFPRPVQWERRNRVDEKQVQRLQELGLEDRNRGDFPLIGTPYSHNIIEDWKFSGGKRAVIGDVEFLWNGYLLGKSTVSILNNAIVIHTCFFNSNVSGAKLGKEMLARIYLRGLQVAELLGYSSIERLHRYYTLSAEEREDYDRYPGFAKKVNRNNRILRELLTSIGFRGSKGMGFLDGAGGWELGGMSADPHEFRETARANWWDWFYRDRVVRVHGQEFWDSVESSIDREASDMIRHRNDSITINQIVEQLKAMKILKEENINLSSPESTRVLFDGRDVFDANVLNRDKLRDMNGRIEGLLGNQIPVILVDNEIQEEQLREALGDARDIVCIVLDGTVLDRAESISVFHTKVPRSCL